MVRRATVALMGVGDEITSHGEPLGLLLGGAAQDWR